MVDANKAALVVVDMQNDFCTPGGYMDSRGIDITPNRAPIEPLKRMVARFRLEDVPVIWVNWGVRKDILNIAPSVRRAHNPTGTGTDIGAAIPGTRSEILRVGSWGAEVVDELNANGGDIQVTKHRFSGFWDTDLDAILRNLGVKTLFIGGVNLDQCVMTTLEDASFLGYDVILVEDCAATTSPAYLRAGDALQHQAPVRLRHALRQRARGVRRMNGTAFEARLAALELELPRVPVPIARFKPWRRAGDLVYLAGQICEWNGEVRFVGKVGVEHDVATGQSAARICALNLLAALRQACDDDLDRVGGVRAARRLRQLQPGLRRGALRHQRRLRPDDRGVRRPWRALPDRDRRRQPAAPRRGRGRRRVPAEVMTAAPFVRLEGLTQALRRSRRQRCRQPRHHARARCWRSSARTAPASRR